MYSRIALILCFALLGYASLQYYPRWKQKGTEAVIGWDVAGYYWYLPSLFIYHDIKEQSFKDSILKEYDPTPGFYEGYLDNASGHYVMKYSSGTAVAMLPAFFLAHTLAEKKDGFSTPYQLAIQLEWLLIAIVGLVWLRRFLKYYFEDRVVAVTLFLLVFGSNYLNWAAIDVGQTHTFLFALYALLLLQIRAFYLQPAKGRGFRIGLILGWMVLTRPSEIIALLIALLWGIDRLSISSFRSKAQFLGRQYKSLLLALAGGLLVVSIQLIYWKYATGRWIVYSYQNEGFSFLHPYFKKYTFDYAHGWLIRAPLMLLAVAGIIPFVRKGTNKVAVVLFVIFNYYIVASWDVWTYGSRAMIQSYPVMSILLASFVAWTFGARWKLVGASLLYGAFIYYNVWWTYFSHSGILWPGMAAQDEHLLDSENMSGRYFRRIAGRWHSPSVDAIKLQDAWYIYEGPPPALNTFYTDAGQSGLPLLVVDQEHSYSRQISVPLLNIGGGWIRVAGAFYSPIKEWNIWHMRKLVVMLKKGSEVLATQELRLDRFLTDGDHKWAYLDSRIGHQGADSVLVFLDAGGSSKSIQMDSIRISTFK